MVKRDPDDLISATSKNLKSPSTHVMRITLKRGGEHTKLYAKAHSRLARRQISKQIREKASENQNQIYPLYARYKEAVAGKETSENRGERVRLNCEVKSGKGVDFINSFMGVFRVNFFKKKEEEDNKPKPAPSKPDANSHSSLKKVNRNKRNKERRTKRNQIKKQRQELKKRQQRLKSTPISTGNEITA